MRYRHFLPLMFSCCFILASGCSAEGPLAPAAVFTDHMVLQRDKPVPVWGWARPGREVTVSFVGQSKSAAAGADGKWMVVLDPLKLNSKPQTMTIAGAEKFTLDDILVGDVWLCSGQSNMGRNVARSVIPEGMKWAYPTIRYWGAGQPVTFENVRVGEVWLVLTHWVGKQYGTEGPVPNANTRIRAFDESRNNHSPTPTESFGRNDAWGPGARNSRFDVMSIPFANRLSDKLRVPVGIVRVRVGDLEATIPFQGFAAVGPLKDIAQRVDTWYPATKRGKEAYEQWLGQMKEWQRTLGRKIQSGEHIAPGQPPLAPGPVLGDPTQPTVVFNRQLNPIVPFAFRGALHVHNESNTGDPRCTRDPRYAHKMRALIGDLLKREGARAAAVIREHIGAEKKALPAVTAEVERHMYGGGKTRIMWLHARAFALQTNIRQGIEGLESIAKSIRQAAD